MTIETRVHRFLDYTFIETMLMKPIVSIFIGVLLALTSVAQVPYQFNFQTVARNAAGIPIADQPVGFRISILQGSAIGTEVFAETHSATTNSFGLVNLLIGSGTPETSSLQALDWETGPYFLHIEIDVLNAQVFQSAGVSPLMSVPYALHAKTSEQAGPAGQSAYEVWLDAGNTGSMEDFLAALVGPQGEPGEAAPGGAGNTLQEAYNQGGPGAGRVINAGSGAVEVNLTGGGTTGLQVTSGVPNSSAVRADVSAVGVAVRAESTNASNNFAAIQAITNSTTADNAAIIGNNNGAGYGVAGQIPSNATGTAAVYGSNLRVGGGSGVLGIGFNGVVGTAQGAMGFGVYGLNNNPGNANVPSIGSYGLGYNGVYGQTTNVAQGWAGYFTADLGVEGAGYALGGWFNVSDRRLKSDITELEGSLDRLLQLKGYRYTLNTLRSGAQHADGSQQPSKSEATVHYGVMAQEVEEVFPELVGHRAVMINQGDDTVYKVVNYDELVPVLIEAIRELNQKVEALELELKQR